MIPSPKPTPLFGNLFDLKLSTPIQSMMELAKTYGPIFRLQMPTEDLVIVSSQALMQELSDESRFDKKVHGPLEIVRDFAGDGMITAHTRELNWHKAHRILGAALGPHVLRSMFPSMLDLTRQLVEKWDRQGEEKTINVSDDMTRLTVDTIALCGFGYRLNSFYDPVLHPFVQAMFSGLVEASARVRRPPFINPLLLGRRARYQGDIETMRALAEKILNERIREKKAGAHSERPQDLLDLMLDIRDPETDERLSDENIRHQLVTFLIAGHETTSGLLAFALHELLAAPEVFARVRAQVDEVLGSREPNYDDLILLTEVENVLYETLRLWPTAPAFALQSKADREIIGGEYEVRRNQTILILLPSLHRDPKVWEAPDEFRPERMSRQARRNLPPHAWKPFGNGQRSCIGSAFALQEATLALSMVLQRFDITDCRPQPNTRNTGILESLTLKPESFIVRVKRRKSKPAGLGRLEIPAQSPVIPPSGGGSPIFVYYGSKTGTAKGYAHEISEQARNLGHACETKELNELDLNSPPSGIIVAVCASYHGQPPPNARRLIENLRKASPGTLPGSRFAVFGCGSRDYPKTFQSVPREIDELLERVGGVRLLPRGEADSRNSGSEEFRLWTDSFLSAIPVSQPASLENRGCPFSILPRSESEPNAGEKPEARALAQYFGLDTKAVIRFEDQERNLLEWLNEFNLSQPATNAQIDALAKAAACPNEAARLAGEIANSGPRKTALEYLLGSRTLRISLTDFLKLLNSPGR